MDLLVSGRLFGQIQNRLKAIGISVRVKKAIGVLYGRIFRSVRLGPQFSLAIPRIGNNFSLLESHLLLAMLAQRFPPRLRPGYQPHWTMQGTLGLANGLPMVITAR